MSGSSYESSGPVDQRVLYVDPADYSQLLKTKAVRPSAATPIAFVAIALAWAALLTGLFAGPDAPVLVLSLGFASVTHALIAIGLTIPDRSTR